MDTVFCIPYATGTGKVYIIKNWGDVLPAEVDEWCRQLQDPNGI